MTSIDFYRPFRGDRQKGPIVNPLPHETWDDAIWRIVANYIDSLVDNPIMSPAISVSRAGPIPYDDKKLRLPSIEGLMTYMHSSRGVFDAWSKVPEKKDTCDAIRNYIKTVQLEGGAAGLWPTNMVMRLVGLREHSVVTGEDGGPIEMINSTMTPKEAAEAYARTLHPDKE